MFIINCSLFPNIIFSRKDNPHNFATLNYLVMQLIICPSCQHPFEPSDAIRDEVEKEFRQKQAEIEKDLRSKADDWRIKKEEEFKNKEKELQKQLLLKDVDFKLKETESKKQLELEKQKLAEELRTQLHKEIGGDFENQLKILQQTATDNAERLKTARQKELEFLQKEQEFKNREEELELIAQKNLQEERQKISDEVSQREKQKSEGKETELMMKIRELEMKNESTIRQLEEVKKKNEQGSMQLQGEVQELALEDLLKSTFPIDTISEVGKGVRGADCIQNVRNNFGQDCGKIIYESKRTKNFDKNWIDKLKADMRLSGAEVAVIVTNVMPNDLSKFGMMDGVWICTFAEVSALAQVLRDGIIKVYNATKSQENKGDKMTMLYNYLTSNEFGEQWNAIREGFMSMKSSIQKERDMMEKLWKSREKQLEKVLLNSAHIKGSMEGISGQDSIDFGMLEMGE